MFTYITRRRMVSGHLQKGRKGPILAPWGLYFGYKIFLGSQEYRTILNDLVVF